MNKMSNSKTSRDFIAEKEDPFKQEPNYVAKRTLSPDSSDSERPEKKLHEDLSNPPESSKPFNKFLQVYQTHEIYGVDQVQVLHKLDTLDKAQLVFIQPPGYSNPVWQVSTVFKIRVSFFPTPPIQFKDFTIDSLKNWCFHVGTYSFISCSHKGCKSVFSCFEQAWQQNIFYHALLISLTRSIPKTSASSILNSSQPNSSIKVFQHGAHNYAVVPYNGFVYYSFEETSLSEPELNICAYECLLEKGSNIFPLFNRRTTPYTRVYEDDYFPSGTFRVGFTSNGSVSIKSDFTLCNDCRFSSTSLMKRKNNFSVDIQERKESLFGSFDILTFKDSIHLNRVETETIIRKLLCLKGCIPLRDVYKARVEAGPSSRRFFFLHPQSFDVVDMQHIYDSCIKKLSLLDVRFSANILPDFKKDIPSLRIINSYSTAGTSPINYVSCVPLIAEKEYNFLALKSPAAVNYALIKPTGNSLLRLSKILQTFINNYLSVESLRVRYITEVEFNTLYPNCLNRVYGADWYQHMFSGECMIIKFNAGSWKQLRSAGMIARLESGLPWVKNVLHCAASDSEAQLMHTLFETDFIKFHNDDDLRFSVIL